MENNIQKEEIAVVETVVKTPAKRKSRTNKEVAPTSVVNPIHIAQENLKKYVFVEDTINALELALVMRKNIILWGKGGFGK